MRIATLAAVGAVFLIAADGPGPRVDGAQAEAHAAACRTYENRARFLSRDEPLSFLVQMAEGCRAARRSLAEGDRVERRAAIAFLDRLLEFRDTIISINMDRVYGRDAGPLAQPKLARGRTLSLPEVSQSGEFLIAHRMGLLAAFEDWRARAGDMALAVREAPKS